MDTNELKEIISRHKEWLLSVGVYGEQANLQGVDLADIDFTGLDLGGINLKGAKNLSAAALCNAASLYKTTLSPELEERIKATCPNLFDKP